MNDSDLVTATYTISPLQAVATPSFTPTTNTIFSSNQEVSIICSTSGATIYYTIDGTTPTTSSIQYTVPFTINSTSLIKAIAVNSGMANSDITSATYTKLEKVATPEFYPSSETVFTSSQLVSLACSTLGSSIYYTTDGTTPTASDHQYTAPFIITATSTIKAIAVKPSMTTSEVIVNNLINLSDFDFIDNGTYIAITKYKGTSDKAIIPAIINNKPVGEISIRAFYNCSNLRMITIPNSVTSISSYAFQYCSKLTVINIPDDITTISPGTFSGCSQLSNINREY